MRKKGNFSRNLFICVIHKSSFQFTAMPSRLHERKNKGERTHTPKPDRVPTKNILIEIMCQRNTDEWHRKSTYLNRTHSLPLSLYLFK